MTKIPKITQFVSAGVLFSLTSGLHADVFDVDDPGLFFTPQNGVSNDSGSVTDGTLTITLSEAFGASNGAIDFTGGTMTGREATAGDSELFNDYFTLTLSGSEVQSINSISFDLVDVDRQGSSLRERFYFNVGDDDITVDSISTTDLILGGTGGTTSHIDTASNAVDNVNGTVTLTGFGLNTGYGFRLQAQSGSNGSFENALVIIDSISVDYNVTAIPEPSTFGVVLGSGILGLMIARRKR